MTTVPRLEITCLLSLAAALAPEHWTTHGSSQESSKRGSDTTIAPPASGFTAVAGALLLLSTLVGAGLDLSQGVAPDIKWQMQQPVLL